MSVAPSSSLRASALTFVLLSIGHTIGGRQWTAEKAFKAIANSKPWACGTVGWYQGSAFFLVSGLLHYQWSRDSTALSDPLNKAMAGIINILLWASSVWYAKNGVKDNAVVVGLSAALQTYAVFKV
ncbi:hypothetical protein N7520_009367 [Penicillium odoratum]|uniref:uncharacterized protein n=1 Tax=Penicillium odoratum TaxID=1167516 RepID=UPI002546D099|nr:uncharacterized protein N7520_009367 [Penicillium odoratum]KAJ5752450.1 hypothetical protein N7520_009367 [Penicillium odoratum]